MHRQSTATSTNLLWPGRNPVTSYKLNAHAILIPAQHSFNLSILIDSGASSCGTFLDVMLVKNAFDSVSHQLNSHEQTLFSLVDSEY